MQSRRRREDAPTARKHDSVLDEEEVTLEKVDTRGDHRAAAAGHDASLALGVALQHRARE